jgi:glutathione S-transferase
VTIRLYSWPLSSASGARWALEELGLSYDYVELDHAKREHRSPEYLAINPNGKVPTLVDGAHPYFESLAILLHLAERYGRERGLWPSDEAGRAEALSWTVWGTAELRPYMMQYVYHALDTPISYKPDERSRAAAEYNGSEFRRVLDALELRLANREYLLGAFSLCDISAASALLFGQKLGVTPEGRANVAAWLARADARPARLRSRGE